MHRQSRLERALLALALLASFLHPLALPNRALADPPKYEVYGEPPKRPWNDQQRKDFTARLNAQFKGDKAAEGWIAGLVGQGIFKNADSVFVELNPENNAQIKAIVMMKGKETWSTMPPPKDSQGNPTQPVLTKLPENASGKPEYYRIPPTGPLERISDNEAKNFKPGGSAFKDLADYQKYLANLKKSDTVIISGMAGQPQPRKLEQDSSYYWNGRSLMRKEVVDGKPIGKQVGYLPKEKPAPLTISGTPGKKQLAQLEYNSPYYWNGTKIMKVEVVNGVRVGKQVGYLTKDVAYLHDDAWPPDSNGYHKDAAEKWKIFHKDANNKGEYSFAAYYNDVNHKNPDGTYNIVIRNGQKRLDLSKSLTPILVAEENKSPEKVSVFRLKNDWTKTTNIYNGPYLGPDGEAYNPTGKKTPAGEALHARYQPPRTTAAEPPPPGITATTPPDADKKESAGGAPKTGASPAEDLLRKMTMDGAAPYFKKYPPNAEQINQLLEYLNDRNSSNPEFRRQAALALGVIAQNAKPEDRAALFPKLMKVLDGESDPKAPLVQEAIATALINGAKNDTSGRGYAAINKHLEEMKDNPAASKPAQFWLAYALAGAVGDRANEYAPTTLALVLKRAIQSPETPPDLANRAALRMTQFEFGRNVLLLTLEQANAAKNSTAIMAAAYALGHAQEGTDNKTSPSSFLQIHQYERGFKALIEASKNDKPEVRAKAALALNWIAWSATGTELGKSDQELRKYKSTVAAALAPLQNDAALDGRSKSLVGEAAKLIDKW